jgi:hypothetical protein
MGTGARIIRRMTNWVRGSSKFRPMVLLTMLSRPPLPVRWWWGR